MASKQKIIELNVELNLNLDDETCGAIAGSTQPNFDYDWVLRELRLKERITPSTIKTIINKCKPQAEDRCGYCRETWIPILDYHTWKELGFPIYETDINVPKLEIPCPNCSPKPERAQRVLNSMPEDAQGWSYAILYAWIHYGLNHKQTPEAFDLRKYYPTLDFYPALSKAQIKGFVGPVMTGKKLKFLPEV